MTGTIAAPTTPVADAPPDRAARWSRPALAVIAVLALVGDGGASGERELLDRTGRRLGGGLVLAGMERGHHLVLGEEALGPLGARDDPGERVLVEAV